MARALVLEEKNLLSIRDIDLDQSLRPNDVRIQIVTVGICGSDVHYYTHGRIGPFVVEAPMVLGHEASGIVREIGAEVTHLAVGDRVCMEPGVPNLASRASKLGIYNVDPDVSFWATPPVHGCLTPEVIHPAAFTYKLPDNVSFAEGAMVEPLAIGMQAATRAAIKPGDTALVIGAGPIGVVTALSALAGGCSRVYISDIVADKLSVAGAVPGLHAIDAGRDDVTGVIKSATEGWGVDIVFECAGVAPAYPVALDAVRPGGCVVFVGMPVAPVPIDITSAQAKELRLETVFRYANIYERAIELLASGKIDLAPLISATYPFDQSIEAFDRAVSARPTDIKIQISMAEDPA
ncbi:NAD(P)-dependent alcohol dehydrogenase [Rhodophyticola sp. CCM32]|uniref:NAD(P)-dependent alcohol dehydrogenase n=1 Tax=Rhodophyticola sp. CCM32 TaxID=2916397 RepID=UPI00107F8FAA|nr:NAD(P)-dependent alcohol dehydrogenase [Rhodophyticola sp. CCM32]QBX99936.1 NAD(P)-dependent alcohol dehydrogenase [Rhodophyticola sp. CCM32]